MIRVRLMPPLRRLVGEKEIVLEAARAPLKAVLQQAAAANPRFQLAVLDRAGNLSSEYTCLVNGRPYNVSDLDGLEVDERDDIVILLPLAGGVFSVPSHSTKGEGEGRGAEGAQFTRGGNAMDAREKLLNEVQELALQNDMQYFG